MCNIVYAFIFATLPSWCTIWPVERVYWTLFCPMNFANQSLHTVFACAWCDRCFACMTFFCSSFFFSISFFFFCFRFGFKMWRFVLCIGSIATAIKTCIMHIYPTPRHTHGTAQHSSRLEWMRWECFVWVENAVGSMREREKERESEWGIEQRWSGIYHSNLIYGPLFLRRYYIFYINKLQIVWICSSSSSLCIAVHAMCWLFFFLPCCF